MTQSIPNSFSMDDLQDLLKDAKTEEETTASCPHYISEIEDSDEYIHAIQEYVVKALNDLSEPLESEDCMVVHKAIMAILIDKMIAFHSKGGMELHKEGNHIPGMCWERDAGKFQAMAVILGGISVGDKDFMCDDD